MNRVTLALGLFASLGASALVSGAPVVAAETVRRPNIIVMVTDDQRHDALGVVQREHLENEQYCALQDYY